MTVLLLGGSGKIGTALRHATTNRNVLFSPSSSELDCADFNELDRIVDACQPRAIINAVVFGSVDACENNPQRALKLNAFLPRHLARRCAKDGIHLIHFSTDVVYSGLSNRASYREDDSPDPINTYGMTKYLGDIFIQEEAKNYHILRIGVLFGNNRKGHQFFEKMVVRAKRGEALKAATDVVTSPTSAMDVAELVCALLEGACIYPPLLHAANSGSASLYDFLSYGLSCLNITAKVDPVLASAFPSVARRSLATPLASNFIVRRPWQEALLDYCQATLNAISSAKDE